MTQGEKRNYIRRESLHLLDYIVIDKYGIRGRYSMGRTLDVSENGIKLETNQPLALRDTLIITVGLEEDLVDLQGEIAYSKPESGRFHTGIEFSEISDEGRRIFKKYSEAFTETIQANPND